MQPLPEKINAALIGQLASGERVGLVLKTAWKPSATIPILWLAVTDRRCFLFSSLRGSHLFDEATFTEINSALKEGNRLRILRNDGRDDWILPIDSKFVGDIDGFLSDVNSRRRS
jgi:hypothetical protein